MLYHILLYFLNSSPVARGPRGPAQRTAAPGGEALEARLAAGHGLEVQGGLRVPLDHVNKKIIYYGGIYIYTYVDTDIYIYR